MNLTKTERDQWRERLSSAYTCFDAAHADFTIRLLDALEEVEADRRRLDREADWLANFAVHRAYCPFPLDCRYPDDPVTLEPTRSCKQCILEAARKAVEERR